MESGEKVPCVGIILPAYNQGAYVDDAIESLRRQTFQDFEVTLLDDGSNDGSTPDKLASLEYDKITSKHLFKTNVGASARYNPFLRKAQNKYVMILCGDDMLAPSFLEECVGFLEKHRKYAAVSPWIEYFGAYEGVRELDESKLALPDILFSDAAYLGSCLMRREAVQQIKLDAMKRQADFDRWLSFIEKGWKLGVIEKPLFRYRQTEKSQWRTNTNEIEIEVKRFVFRKHQKLFAEYCEEVYLHFIDETWKKSQEASWISGERDEAIAGLEKERAKTAELNAELSKVLNSKSWKMTGPVRKLSRLTKKK